MWYRARPRRSMGPLTSSISYSSSASISSASLSTRAGSSAGHEPAWNGSNSETWKMGCFLHLDGRVRRIAEPNYGLLQPLDIPHQAWRSISMAFISGLPGSNGFTQIWVVADQLTKIAHFISMVTCEKSPAKDLARRLHCLPADTVSDRSPVFISSLRKELMEHLREELNMSTAFSPQTDGQTERINHILEGDLRHNPPSSRITEQTSYRWLSMPTTPPPLRPRRSRRSSPTMGSIQKPSG